MWEFLELILELAASAVDVGEVWRFFLCFAGAAIAAGLIDAFYPDRAHPACAIVFILGCTFGGAWEIGSRL